MQDLTEEKLAEQLAYAEEIMDETLATCIQNLKNADDYHKSDTKISNDFAPRSFYFERMREGKCIMNGGVIYHAGGGDIGPRWQIHT